MTCECDTSKNFVTDDDGNCKCKDEYERIGDKCELPEPFLSEASPEQIRAEYKKKKQCAELPN